MTTGKRLMDLGLALVLSVVLLVPIIVIALLILVTDGRPVFYRSERMKTPDRSFDLWKFRTMTGDPNDFGVSSAFKNDRITTLGRALRRFRLDELPQLYNILRGDMSFVGPRPPLRCYVELRPDLYAAVLRNRPGVTGLATILYHQTEERLLSHCHTAEETHDTYLRRCVPAKARLDLLWADNRTLCFDIVLIGRTLTGVFARRKGKLP